MNPINHDDLIKLNERLDTILSSEKALEAAAKSKSSVFRAAAELTSAEHPQLSDAMRERMRAKILQAVPVAQIPPKKAILRPNFGGMLAKVASLVLVLLFLGLATPPALANSLPGDALYPAKRGLENVELFFAGNAVGQVNVHLNHSERRIDESDRLLAKGRFEPEVMDDALTSLETAFRIANDNNLFEQDAALEARSNEILSDFTQTLDTAEAAQLLPETELARLEASEEEVTAFLPSRMEEPSSSSEVTSTVEPTPTTEVVSTDIEVEASPEETEVPVEYLEETLVYVNAEGSVNVREGAGTAYPVIARVSPSGTVTAIGVAGDWTQVRLEDGTVGWIANFLLSETPPLISPELTSEPSETVVGTPPVPGGNVDTSEPGSGGSSTSECERGRSCEAPGHGNGNNNGNAGGGRGN